MRNIKYFDKPALIGAAVIAVERGYNRQLNVNEIAKLPSSDLFPVSFSMLHEHAAGVKVDAHIRARIVINQNGDAVMLDVDMNLFNSLPIMVMSDQKENAS